MMKVKYKHIFVTFIVVMLMTLIVSACAPAPTAAPTQDTSAIQTQAAQTVVADLTANAPPPPTQPPATQPPPPTSAPTEAPPPPGPTPDPNIPVAVVPTPASGEPAAVALYNTTIFSGPGENYVVYAAFLGGATAKVTGVSEDGLWWVISVPPAPNGQGWVSGAWVAVSGAEGVPQVPTPPVPPTAEMVPPEPEDPQAMAIANVYVRTGPGTNYPAYGIAPAGNTGRVIGKSEDGEWWVVRLNPDTVGAGYGWVMAEYTQAYNVESVQTIATPPAPETVAPPPPPEGVPVATAVDYVNVRSGPGTNYPILAVAPPGASAEVSGKSSDGAWWQVKIPTEVSPDGFGWVSADWVVTQNTESVPVVEAPAAPAPVPTAPPPSTSATGCQLVSQSPADGTVFSPGTSFNTTWVLQNTGTTKWDQNEYNLQYLGAAANIPLHQGPDGYDLTSTVEPGWTYNFSVPMIAPFEPGVYGELWHLALSNQTVCQFYVYITVQ
jgi:uncharacterized protein YraI